MNISDKTERKLAHLRTELYQEFASLSPAHIDEQFREIEHDILARARFDDFVPLLVDRYVRQRLASVPGATNADQRRERAVAPANTG